MYIYKVFHYYFINVYIFGTKLPGTSQVSARKQKSRFRIDKISKMTESTLIVALFQKCFAEE